jgi:CubicO group peptidase (beta-lactamase class C family)
LARARAITRRTQWLLVICALAVSTLAFYAYQFAAIGSAYVAHMLCSGVFIAGRTSESIIATDLTADDLAPMRYVGAHVDAHRVTASVFGLATRTAIYRDGLGCTLSDDVRASSPSPLLIHIDRDAWTTPTAVSADRQRQLNEALDWAFAEPDPRHQRRTRAVVVLHDGHLAAERYADGFTKDTPLIGWSMSKSVVNALVGILVGTGSMSLDAPLPIAAWRPGDPRRAITLDHLLRMSSGLDFDEESINPRSGVLYMLLRAPDVPAYAESSPLAAAPGTRWRYSSATTNVITGAMRRVVGEADYAMFPRRALFDRIGMHSAVVETDAHGNFIGSSFMWATARDWARFGQLYLDDGVWRGERVLPPGWVTYSRTPAPAAPDRRYGAHFWLTIADGYRSGSPGFELPADAFHAVGHEGQFVTIIPSRRVVIVRLGLTRSAGAWAQDEFVTRVLRALGD